MDFNVSFRQLTAFGLVALACAGAVAEAAPFELPALVEPSTATRHPGKVIWADLVTPDLEGAKRFYAGMFGWTFRDLRTGDTEYSLALQGGRPVGGLVHRAAPVGRQRQPAWLTFLAVRDVAEAERLAVAGGAKVLTPARDYPQRGRQEVLLDPQGAVFAILASTSGDPADLLADPGDWIWSSLITSDADAGAAFYQAVFDYEIFELDATDGHPHLLLATEGYARGSVNARPAVDDRRHAHWLNFVRVTSATDAAARVATLGGRVLVPPHPDCHGGLVAVVADPWGAPFGLLEWSESDSKEVGP